MRQITLASQGSFERYGKKTRREKFLEEMEESCRGRSLQSLIEPYYPKEGNGRPPVGLGIMLRIYFLQHWFNLSDPAAEEALYDSPALRRFAGVDLGRAPAPDETTILNFRHLLERHDLCGAMLDAVNHYLEDRGIRIGTGTIVDATIIHAPSSTKNATGTRDPEMHQTRKGNQWYFGMKAHIGVDTKEGIYIRCAQPRPVWPTSTCCRTSCMVMSARCGATEAIRGRARRSAPPRRMPRT